MPDLDLDLSILEPRRSRFREFANDLLRLIRLPDSSCSTLDVLELDDPLFLPPLELDSVMVEEVSELSNGSGLKGTVNLVETNLKDAKLWLSKGRLASSRLTRSVERMVLSSKVDRNVGGTVATIHAGFRRWRGGVSDGGLSEGEGEFVDRERPKRLLT